ncbi:uncharacterized protein [Physcomitrium patens]|nr:uncharacterized protein LOC112285494 isoform X3 [Physcomitrium patens]|eukprot:XP_024382141.1 uncharacterized protein LOC112285494 isoform X3 [Physcomitrella patens]
MAGSMCPATVLSGPSCARVSSPSWNVLNRASKCFIRVSKFAPLFCGALKTRKRDQSTIFRVSVKSSHIRAEVKNEPVDVVILTNGPGEVATWVKPVVARLRRTAEDHAMDMRISVLLAPCPHASGKELQLLQSFDEIDRCQGPEEFYSLLLLGRTRSGWDWRRRGVCIFLGGDQFNTLILGWRLGYKTVVYAEDAARWPGFVDLYMLRSEELVLEVPQWARSRCLVVGDLFVDAVGCSPSSISWSLSDKLQSRAQDRNVVPIVGLLPGSKDAKLAIGVPYFMAVADHLHQLLQGQVRFVLPLAPTVTVTELERFADAASNPLISRFHWSSGHFVGKQSVKVEKISKLRQEEPEEGSTWNSSELLKVEELGQLVTEGGVVIDIQQQFPPYSLYQGCSVCLTTVGTNTAELGTLGVPMLVVLPTYFLETFRGATGGILGLLSAIPGQAGAAMAHFVNLFILKTAGFISWPNRWAGETIVPELIGEIDPQEVAALAAEYLQSPDRLQAMHERLLDLQMPRSVSKGGAAHSIAVAVQQLLYCVRRRSDKS